MVSQGLKKSLTLSDHLALSIIFSFAAVIVFSFVLHAIDMRMQGKDLIRPFVEQFKGEHATLLCTPTIAEAALFSKDKNGGRQQLSFRSKGILADCITVPKSPSQEGLLSFFSDSTTL